MLILGIETSCDETSAAVVDGGRFVRSNVVLSQVRIHAPYGGVVPEIASRQHIRAISGIVDQALKEADVSRQEIDLVAATHGPGLAGSLLVGLNYARGLALGLQVPFVPANHLEGHLYSIWLTRENPPPAVPEFPVLTLIVSGGHTELVLMGGHGEYELVGHTLDDAAGEAFDKVGRLLGLAYPGGPAIQSAAEGAQEPAPLPRAWLPNTFDFSFSGLKTAVLHLVHETVTGRDAAHLRGKALAQIDVASELSATQVAEIAAGFQESVVDVLVTKTAAAAKRYNPRSVAVVGGVAANKLLRLRMRETIQEALYIAAPEFSTDNGAMIAAAAFYVRRGEEEADVQPSLALTSA